MDAERVFNMNEMGFGQSQRTKKVGQSQRTKKVVAVLHGSKNVWSKTFEANCHMTITAYVLL